MARTDMVANLRRPILVGGIGLSLTLWLWDSVGESAVELGETALFGAIALGGGLWWLQRQVPKPEAVPTRSQPVDRETVEAAITRTETAIDQLAAEAETAGSEHNLAEAIASLRSRAAALRSHLDRQELRWVITGAPKVGKTALKTVLETAIKTEKPFTLAEVADDHLPELETADLVLFLVAGDITDPEYKTLRSLCDRQRVLLVWNKQDQCPLANQVVVLQQLRDTVAEQLTPEDVVGVAASPSPIKVRKYEDEGSVREWMEEQSPELEMLTERLDGLLQKEAEMLVWATTEREAIALRGEVKNHLNQIRRDRALPIVEQYQWIAAASAFANPVPALDILATAAIGTQLVVDLGKIYRRQFSLEQAGEVAKTLGAQMVKLGLVELSTKTLSTILKSNSVTYVAGGAIQGVSAAYLTRIAGLSLIEYFQTRENEESEKEGVSLNVDSLKNIIQGVFQNNQQLGTLKAFVGQAMNHVKVEQKPSLQEAK
nr:DUF697 domain-containing protein [Lyngbya sp. CCY1209]